MKMITIDGIQIPESKLAELGYTKQEAPKSKVFTPFIGDEYFAISAEGTVRRYVWRASHFDTDCFVMGNIYQTELDALNKRARAAATTRVLNKLRELEVGDDLSFHVSYSASLEQLVVAQMMDIYFHTSWYSSHDAWRWVIDNMENDVLMMLGVTK